MLAWKQPVDVGGCSILDYQVQVDDGALGAFVQFGASLSASKFTVEVTGLTYTFDYRFMIIASSHIGSSESKVVTAVVANVPNTPTTAPFFNPSFTTTTSLRVEVNEVTANGGTPITNYQL